PECCFARVAEETYSNQPIDQALTMSDDERMSQRRPRAGNGGLESVESRRKSLAILEAAPTDAEAVARVRKESWLATYPNEELGISREQIAAKDFDSSEAIEQVRGWLCREDHEQRAWVAKAAGTVVGFCSASREESEHRIGATSVSPLHQSQGAGQELLRAALAWLGDEKPVTLEVASYNHRAIHFYEQQGF